MQRWGRGEGTKQDSSSSWGLPASLFQAPKHGCASLSGLVGRKEFGVGMEAEYSQIQEAKSVCGWMQERGLEDDESQELGFSTSHFPNAKS